MTHNEPDDARWFDSLGGCFNCAKPANGKLMDSRNQSYGAYCAKCATARLEKAKKERTGRMG